jgi:hypothetical protein
MKKSSFFACIILFAFFQFTQAQSLSDREKNKLSNNGYEFKMYQESTTYCINDMIYGEDFIFGNTLSYGHYKYIGNKLILTDSITKQKLTYKIIDKFWLYPVKTYCYLSDVIWRQEGESYEKDNDSNENSLTFYAIEKDTSVLISNLLQRKLSRARLSHNESDNYLSDGTELTFYHDSISSYIIFEGNRVVSSGFWKKKLNRIEIYDECLDRKFYFKIKNGIIGKNNFPSTESKNKFEKTAN